MRCAFESLHVRDIMCVQSGMLDITETRACFRALYPGLSAEQMRHAMYEMLDHLHGQNEVWTPLSHCSAGLLWGSSFTQSRLCIARLPSASTLVPTFLARDGLTRSWECAGSLTKRRSQKLSTS